MACEQNLRVQFESTSNEEMSKSVTEPTVALENLKGCFDCNICLDTARDPVVTLCGHLYCWPCIYKWFHVVNSSMEIDKQSDCPVCKASISETTLVPLYGRGDSQSDHDAKQSDLNIPVPRRPSPIRPDTLPQGQPHSTPFQSHQPTFHPQQYFPHPLSNNTPLSPPNFVDTGLTSPTAGMFGEMFYARIFGSSDTSLFSYPHASYYSLVRDGSPSPRVRRQELQVDKSLSRVSMFLLCCLILCLLLF